MLRVLMLYYACIFMVNYALLSYTMPEVNWRHTNRKMVKINDLFYRRRCCLLLHGSNPFRLNPDTAAEITDECQHRIG